MRNDTDLSLVRVCVCGGGGGGGGGGVYQDFPSPYQMNQAVYYVLLCSLWLHLCRGVAMLV